MVSYFETLALAEKAASLDTSAHTPRQLCGSSFGGDSSQGAPLPTSWTPATAGEGTAASCCSEQADSPSTAPRNGCMAPASTPCTAMAQRLALQASTPSVQRANTPGSSRPPAGSPAAPAPTPVTGCGPANEMKMHDGEGGAPGCDNASKCALCSRVNGQALMGVAWLMGVLMPGNGKALCLSFPLPPAGSVEEELRVRLQQLKADFHADILAAAQKLQDVSNGLASLSAPTPATLASAQGSGGGSPVGAEHPHQENWGPNSSQATMELGSSDMSPSPGKRPMTVRFTASAVRLGSSRRRLRKTPAPGAKSVAGSTARQVISRKDAMPVKGAPRAADGAMLSPSSIGYRLAAEQSPVRAMRLESMSHSWEPCSGGERVVSLGRVAMHEDGRT